MATEANNMDMEVAAMNPVADMEVAVTNPVAVGRGAHGKRTEVAATNPVAVGRGACVTRNSSRLDAVVVTNTPTSNHGIGVDKVFLSTPVTNTGAVIEEEQHLVSPIIPRLVQLHKGHCYFKSNVSHELLLGNFFLPLY
jgi:hypothetical protein